MQKIFQKVKNMLKISSRNYKILVALSSVVVTATVGFLIVQATITGGDVSLNPTAAPGDTMVSLDDIYHRLAGGSAISYGIDSSTNPAGTMHTLSEINAITPNYAANPGNAVAANVCRNAAGNYPTFYTSASTTAVTGAGTACAACGGTATAANIAKNLTADINCDGQLEAGTNCSALPCFDRPAGMNDTCQTYCASLGCNCLCDGGNNSTCAVATCNSTSCGWYLSAHGCRCR